MGNEFALGLDLGTSALKAIVIDDKCHVISVTSRRYPLSRPGPGLAEQDPDNWWAAVVSALHDLEAQGVELSRIACIGLSGQMHGLVLVGDDGEALLPCQTWADTRCTTEAQLIDTIVGRSHLRAIAGSPSSTSATAAKLLWVRGHAPDLYSRARSMLMPKDHLRWRLTGTWATDATDASGALLCDIAGRKWSEELVDELGIRYDLLPPILESGTIAGTLTSDAATALGLRAGIPICAGAGDAECAAVGMGLVGEPDDRGLALATLGTGAQFSAIADHPLLDPSGRTQTLCHAVPGRWHVMTAILAGASALSWLASVMLPDLDDGTAVRMLLAEAAREPVCARNLLFFPHLNGVRLPEPDAGASGAFVGLRPEHTRAMIARAAAEGVTLALRDGLVAMQDLGIFIERIRLAGGANRAPLWPRIQADVFGLPVEIGSTEDASALGAALLGGVGVGLLPSLHDATHLATAASPTSIYRPDPEIAHRFSEIHSQWQTIDSALRMAQFTEHS